MLAFSSRWTLKAAEIVEVQSVRTSPAPGELVHLHGPTESLSIDWSIFVFVYLLLLYLMNLYVLNLLGAL